MNKKDFFVKENDIVDLDIFGQKFQFKKVTADDELSWLEDYQEKHTEKVDGKEVVTMKQNFAKLVKCKLRNIVGVPFTKEELYGICNINKPYSEYTNEDKSKLFGLLNPRVMDELIRQLDDTKKNKKKS